MIKFIGKLPNEIIVACSGGIDSMAVTSFLQNSPRKVYVVYFNHGTKHGNLSEEFLKDRFGSSLIIGSIKEPKSNAQSWEEYWRIERYKFLHSFKLPVVTAHHLGDQMENWIFTSLHGNPRLIPYSNQNVIRPFMISSKGDFEAWCQAKNISWIDDESNNDVKFMRNKIRHDLLPQALMINPGLATVLKKKILKEIVPNI